jgi:hypothetical protein
MQSERKKLQRELSDHLREKDAAQLRLLRAQINHARVSRRGLLAAARTQCRVARVSLKERQADERQRLTLEHQAQRELGRSVCQAGKADAKRDGLEHGAKRTLKEERIYQRRIRAAGKPVKVRATARELAAEDDDAVRSNLPAELVPVFDAVRKKIKGNAKRSRTEAFLEWAEENPDEILAVQEAKAEQYLRELVKSQRDLGRSVRKADRYKQTPEELEALLAAVPF